MSPNSLRHHPYAPPSATQSQSQSSKAFFSGGPIRPHRTLGAQNPRRSSASDAVYSGISTSSVPVSKLARFKYGPSPINRVLWTPTGRLITGSRNGDLTAWDGLSFRHELTVGAAHEGSIRSMVWSFEHEDWISGDEGGCIKYWKTMSNESAIPCAHEGAVRDLSFCRTNLKFCSCSDDSLVKVWDYETSQEVRRLSGHCWNVAAVDWHPTKSLVASGGKDGVAKLWDARTERDLATFYDHNSWVNSVKWNQNGNWLLTGSKDQAVKLYDIRSMKEVLSFRGRSGPVTALAWHPLQEDYFVSGTAEGSILHWLVGHLDPQVQLPNAHNGNDYYNSVWDLKWHASGDMLCSGGNDRTTKFWCKIRPGDDVSNVNENPQSFAVPSSPFAMSCSFPLPSNEIKQSLVAKIEGTIIPGVGIAVV